MKKWKANKLPAIGCPMCMGDGFLLGDGCKHCSEQGYFPIKQNSSVNINIINNNISKSIQNGNTN